MTKEDIIRMAREAGLMSFKYPALIAEPDWEATERFAALVAAAAIKDAPDYKMGYADGVAAEREACAQICDNEWSTLDEAEAGTQFAKQIRERSTT